MHHSQKTTRNPAVVIAVMLVTAATANTLYAEEWQGWLGAESRDLGSQALAFLPNEFWIHANDSIRWTIATTEIHTVTFLIPPPPSPPGQLGQVRPRLFGPTWDVQVGCPGVTPDGSSFDGTKCVNSGILGTFDSMVGPQSYSVNFPTPGNFKLVCLVHADMTGSIHVLNASETLPYDQDFYNREAQTDGRALVAEASGLTGRGRAENNDGGPYAKVTAGVDEITTRSGAGSQTPSLVRFLPQVIVIRVGDTVEWRSLDASIGHSVTFGTEPADPRPPSANVLPTSDGAREAVISLPNDSAHSGVLLPASQDRPNLGVSAIGVARFRVTFKSPGTFNYICALHDNLGMKGTVIVHR